MKTTLKIIAVSTLVLLSACDQMNNWNKPAPQPEATNPAPKIGSLTQNLNMVDGTGRIYGTVQLDPINGGKIFDADGRLIGRVVNPTPAPLAPALQ